MEEPPTSLWNYCRFCAENKNGDKLIKLDSDPFQISEVLRKLNILKLKLFNSENSNFLLPNTVCFVCWSKFNSAYEFYDTFHRAQEVLKGLDPLFTVLETLSSDDDSHSNCADLTSLHGKDEDDEPLSNYGKRRKKLSCASSSKLSTVKSEEHECLESETTVALSDGCNEDVKINSSHSQTGGNHDNITINTKYSIETTDGSDKTDILNSLVCEKTESTPNNGLYYAKELSLECKIYIKKWTEYPWICYYCGMVLPNVESLREHSKFNHLRCAAFKCIDCTACDCENHDFQAFIRHVRKHRKHLRKVCPYCDIKTDNFKAHLRSHLTNETLNCPTCGELFSNNDQYAQHMLLSISNNNKTTIKEQEPKRKRRKPGQVITKEDLTCDICQKVYKNLNILRDHKRVQHSTENRRIFTCEKCGKSFLNKGSLTTHIMGHNKINPYQCRLCDKGFKFPNLLRRHVDTHSGLKRFKCDQCGRAFRLLSQVAKHKIVHTDTMPFVCQYCPKSFRFKSILDIHERQHTGAKPYSCNECVMEFTNWSNYNKHSKRRHGLDLSKKKITPQGSFPVDPVTGRMLELDESVVYEEWRKQVMLPCKRGPKKGFKEKK